MIKNALFNSASVQSLRSDLAEGQGTTVAMSTMATASRKDMIFAIAEKIDQNPEMLNHLSLAARAKEVSQYSLIQCWIDLDHIFGEDELKLWPVVNSEKGQNPDKYEQPVKVAGETKMRKTTFYKELAGSIGKGKELQGVIDAVSEAGDDPSKTSHPIVGKMLAKIDRMTARDKAKQELGVYVSTVKNTLRFCQKAWEFETLTHIKWNFLMETVMENVQDETSGKMVPRVVMVDETDDEGEPTGKKVAKMRPRSTPNPVKITNVHNTDEFATLSIGSFSNLDIDTIKLAGGTFEAFIASRKRERDEDEVDNEAQNVVVNNLATFETAAAGMAGWLEREGNVGLLKKRLDAAIKAGKLDDISGMVESVRELSIELQGIESLINKAWDKIQIAKDTKATGTNGK